VILELMTGLEHVFANVASPEMVFFGARTGHVVTPFLPAGTIIRVFPE
jgi:hypothetical protein